MTAMTEETRDTPPAPPGQKPREAKREAALARHLRANLARRKAAQRARGESSDPEKKPE